MKHLDYRRFLEILERHLSTPEEVAARQAGAPVAVDSGYTDIMRFFGPGAEPPGNVKLQYKPGRFRFADARIAAFAEYAAERLREAGRLRDGPQTLCVVEPALTSSPPGLTAQACRYEDLAGSCFSLDFPHPSFQPWGGTLREYCLREYGFGPLSGNPLPQGLGVCAMLLVSEGRRLWTLSPRRSARLASLEGSQGPSVAGSVDYATWESLQDLFDDSLASETVEELNLDRADFEAVPLAYARELFRGGKPQLFGLLKTARTRAEIETAASRIDPGQRESDGLTWIEVSEQGVMPPRDLGRLNHEARMNWSLVAEYFDAIG